MKNKCYAKFGRGQGVCLFVCFYGPSVEVNKLVFEGQLRQIPNRGDHVGNQSENNTYFRLPTCEGRHMKTRRKLNLFLYRFLQVFTLLSFLKSPVYHYTRFWNSLCKLSVKLLVCTKTALLKVHNDLLMNMDSQRLTLLVLLDRSAAFDTVDIDVSLSRLEYELWLQGLCFYFGLRLISLTDLNAFLSTRNSFAI